MSFLFSSFKQPHFEADACRGEVSIQNGGFNKILIRFTSPSRMVWLRCFEALDSLVFPLIEE